MTAAEAIVKARGSRGNSVVRAQQCTCSWLWVQGSGLESGGFRLTLKFPGLRKGRNGPLGPIRGSPGCCEKQKREQMLVGQIQQMSTRATSSVHALGTVGTMGACSKDTASAWRFQSLRLSAQTRGPSCCPHHLCILLDLGAGSGSCGNTTEHCLFPGCLLEK